VEWSAHCETHRQALIQSCREYIFPNYDEDVKTDCKTIFKADIFSNLGPDCVCE
jgi:hypothetical protein